MTTSPTLCRLPRASIPLARAVGIVFALFASIAAVQAQEAGAAPPVRLAAVGDGTPSPQPSRLARPEVDLLQLAQTTNASSPTAAERENLVVVAVDIARPESLDDEIAAAHGLELVRRLPMTGIGLRVISYRIRDGRPLADVVARLRADTRVTSAQANVVYRPVPKAAPDTSIASVPPAPRRPAPSAERQSPRRASTHRTVPRAVTARAGESEPGAPRVRVADVLAGGL